MREEKRQRLGEGLVWKNEKINKWEVPSYTPACKSTDPPPSCLNALEIRKAIAFPSEAQRSCQN